MARCGNARQERAYRGRATHDAVAGGASGARAGERRSGCDAGAAVPPAQGGGGRDDAEQNTTAEDLSRLQQLSAELKADSAHSSEVLQRDKECLRLRQNYREPPKGAGDSR